LWKEARARADSHTGNFTIFYYTKKQKDKKKKEKKKKSQSPKPHEIHKHLLPLTEQAAASV